MQNKSDDYKAHLESKLKLFKTLIPLSPENKWEALKSQSRAKVWKKKEDNSDLYYVRIEGQIKVPKEFIKDIITSHKLTSDWDKTLEASETIEEFSKDCRIAYFLLKKPSLLVDKRDSIVLNGNFEEDGKLFIVGGSADHGKFSIKKGVIRCEIKVWGWMLTSNLTNANWTDIVYVSLSDPKGNIPKFVLSGFLADQGSAMDSLQQYAEKKYPAPKL